MTVLRTTRVSEAYGELKARILDGRIAPGFQASEPEIAELLGMSRTPVREAMVSLEAEGLLELVPRRGARVLPLSIADMQEIYGILTVLEPEAIAGLADDPCRQTKCAGLVQAVDDMEAALDAGDMESWSVADDQFHRELLEHQGNRRLAAFALQLYEQSHRVRILTLQLRPLPTHSTAEHRAVLDLILAGKADEARESFRTHRKRASAELLNVLDHYKLLPEE